jgi:cell division protein FtsW
LENKGKIQDRIFSSFQGVGNSLAIKTKGDRVIWAVVIMLTLASLLLVYSSTSSLAFKSKSSNSVYLLRQMFFIVFGLIVIYFSHHINYTFYSRIALWMFIAAIPLLILTKLFGSSANEATRWIKIPIVNMTFQTSDFAKLALFMYISRLLARKQDVIKSFKNAFLPLIFPICIICFLIAIDNFSTGALLFASCLLLLFIGRVSLRHIGLIVGIGLIPVIIILYYATNYYDKNKEELKDLPSYVSIGRVPTWISRVQTFIYPSKKGNRDAEHQQNQAKIAIAQGGVFGLMPGNSTQKNFLPDSFSDFIYAIVIEEYGLIGGTTLIFLYLLFLYRSIRIFRRCPFAFGAFLAVGLSFALAIQALVNMAVAVNLFPVTGVTLPLVSMGGTSLLFMCFSIGVILSVARNVEIMEGKAAPEGVIA